MTTSYPTRARQDTAGPGAALRDAVASRAGLAVPEWLPPLRVLLDAGTDARWTVSARLGRVYAEAGRHGRVDATLQGPADLLAAVVRGEVDGARAGFEGRLRTEGALSSALLLGALLGHRPTDRPAGIPYTRLVDAAGLCTLVVDAGPAAPAAPQARPVVLLHGMGADGASMFPTMFALRDDRQVLVPDLPGHGGSAKPRARYHAAFFARWLVDLLDTLGLPHVDLVGNSLGGRVALELGLRYPDRVGAMVLYGPSLAFLRRRRARRLVQALPPGLAAAPVRLPARAAARNIAAMMADPSRLPPHQLRAAAHEHARVLADPAARVALASTARQIYLEDAVGRRGFWDRLPGLSVPALFLWGEADTFVPPRFARHVRRVLPGAPVVVLPDCGHIPQFEQPEHTHTLTREFLADPVATTARVHADNAEEPPVASAR